MVRISVVISIYNGAKYIEEELESIKNQTKQPDEVLIFDDVSNDGTVEICEKFIKVNNLKNWSIVVNTQNKGWRRNFMEGISQTTGNIVFIADQDDVWAKNKVEIMANVMKQEEEILLLTSDFVSFYTEHPLIQELSDSRELEIIDPRKSFFAMGQPGCTYCIRRELFEDAYKIWKPEFAHDSILWKVAAVKNAIRKVKNDLHYWRRHDDSTFSVESIQKRNRVCRRESLDVMANYLDAISNIDMKPEWKEILKENSKWIEMRKKLYDQRSILNGISLLGTISKYRDFRQYLADVYLALGK